MKKPPKREKHNRIFLPSAIAALYILFLFHNELYAGLSGPLIFLKTTAAHISWFIFVGIIAAVTFYRFIRAGGLAPAEWRNLGFLLPLILFIESLIQYFAPPPARLVYIPFIVFISTFFSLKIVLSCMTAVFISGIPSLWWIEGYVPMTGGIYLAIFTTGLLSHFFFSKKTRISNKAVEALEKLKSSALNLEPSTDSSLFDEDRFSSTVKSVLDTQNELDDILNLTKKVTRADSAALFLLEGDKLVMKASTEKIGPDPLYVEKGYLTSALKEKKALIQPKLKGNFFDIGFPGIKNISSLLCVPILEGEAPIGVLTLESRKEAAFDEPEMDIATDIAHQIRLMLAKTRLYLEVERFAKGFRALHEASKTLSTSLRVEEIAEQFVERVSGMISSPMVGFFLADRGRLRIIAKKGFEPEKESFYSKGTYFDLVLKNRQLLHFSNMDKKQGVYPFKAADTRSFLGIPVISENDVIGILAVTSKEPDAISSFQVHMLKIAADLAAMSITNAQLHNEVEKLAITDGLTGLYNHRYFQTRLEEEFQRIVRIPQPFTLMLIDIDYFKKINDEYGHQAGDAVLAELGLILRKTLRGIDMLARYGGEEFAAVLMGTDGSGAHKMAERLRSYVMNNQFFIDDNKLSITLSIGISAYNSDAVTKDELIEKADQAMYYAKNNGRNQVCLWRDIAHKI